MLSLKIDQALLLAYLQQARQDNSTLTLSKEHTLYKAWQSLDPHIQQLYSKQFNKTHWLWYAGTSLAAGIVLGSLLLKK